MRPGMICNWLDVGPAVLLETAVIENPLSCDDAMKGIEADWEIGWRIKLLETDEVLTVHADTLDQLDN